MNLLLLLLLPRLPTLVASVYGDIFGTATVSETADGTLLIQSAPARHVAWVVVFPLVLLVSRWCWRRHMGVNFAPGLFFASFVIPLIIIPCVPLESVRITPQALTIRTGFWFSPTIHEVSLTDVTRIAERDEAPRSRRLPVPETHWRFQHTSGQWQSIDLPDLLEANRAAASYLARHGLPVKPVDLDGPLMPVKAR